MHQRIPYTCARKKIGAAADCIDACHQKITPQLRRKTMQWLRRRSEPCELRGGLFLAAWSPIRKRSERRHAFSCGCGICDKNEMARSFVYLCAPLSPPAPLLPPPFLFKHLLGRRPRREGTTRTPAAARRGRRVLSGCAASGTWSTWSAVCSRVPRAASLKS